jgi:predicted dehydrogenase
VKAHRILVSGAGSIGERHIRNLLRLGHDAIAVHRVRGLPFRTLDRDFPVYNDLGQALAEFRPTVVFVTNPTASHMPVALEAAAAGCHLFIEKPLSHTLEEVGRLQRLLSTHRRSAMVGYMLRFHPLFRRVKAWLDEGPEGRMGRPLFVRASWGENVIDWHPWEDYRESYAVRPEMGGGPALTLSHEYDLLVWLLGLPQEVIGMAAQHSPLEAACEHTLDTLIRFESGAVANVHLDYCQRPPSRSWEIVGTRGRASVDYFAGLIQRWDLPVGGPPVEGAPRGPAETHSLPHDFDRNDLFVAELEYFFDCLDRGVDPAPGVEEAAQSVAIALRALGRTESCCTGGLVA